MIDLLVEVGFEDERGLANVEEPPPQDASAGLFEALTEWWVQNAAEPYMSLSLNERMDPLTVSRRFLEEDVFFEVAFDYDLLENSAELYAAFGWGALEQVAGILKPLPISKQQTKLFYRMTMNTVAVMVAHGLIELESQATAYAKRRWTDALDTIDEYLQAFDTIQYTVDPHYQLRDRKLAEELIGYCRDYAMLTREARRLQEDIDERNRIDPPKRRQKGSGQELWFEVFASAQRPVLNKMADLSKQIAATFPPALLVLDRLPGSLLSAESLLDKTLAQAELDGMIGRTLADLRADTQALQESLQSPGATQALVDLLKPMLVESKDLSGLRKLEVPEGGFEQEVLDIVFERKERKDQRVFANLEMLLSFYDEPEGVEPGTWFQVVLYQYCVRLAETVDKKMQDEVFWDQFWGWIGRATALLGLIALMAVFPFGEYAAPGLVLLLTLSGTFSAILAALTLLHDVTRVLEAKGQLEADARDRLFRLAQMDPEAIAEIGLNLSRSKALRDGLLKGSFVAILTMGAGRVLKPLATALNFQGFVEDVQTLFSPVTEDG